MLAVHVRCAAAGLAFLVVVSVPTLAQEGVFLSGADVARAVFPDADRFDPQRYPATEELRAGLKAGLGSTVASVWEADYLVFTAWRGTARLGRAFLVEEIGKHRPITFVVGVVDDGQVRDVAVVAYREAYGGEVRNRRFLSQYRGKGAADSLQPYQAIKNIAGATLSVEAASRAVRKALVLAKLLGEAHGASN